MATRDVSPETYGRRSFRFLYLPEKKLFINYRPRGPMKKKCRYSNAKTLKQNAFGISGVCTRVPPSSVVYTRNNVLGTRAYGSDTTRNVSQALGGSIDVVLLFKKSI